MFFKRFVNRSSTYIRQHNDDVLDLVANDDSPIIKLVNQLGRKLTQVGLHRQISAVIYHNLYEKVKLA